MVKEEEKELIKEKWGISIDYDNIDVEDIMRQIKRKIASQPKRYLDVETLDRESRNFPALGTIPLQNASGLKAGIKRILLKIMMPLSPVIKSLVLPVHQEVMETNFNLNRRLDVLNNDLTRTMEYSKLFHNLSHNIVVELSKLKIEEEDLKLKARILEKDFELLKLREKALEEKVYK